MSPKPFILKPGDRSAALNVIGTKVTVRKNMGRGIGGGITRGEHRIPKPIPAAINGYAGRTLDDALRIETIKGYSCVGDFREVRERLAIFLGKENGRGAWLRPESLGSQWSVRTATCIFRMGEGCAA